MLCGVIRAFCWCYLALLFCVCAYICREPLWDWLVFDNKSFVVFADAANETYHAVGTFLEVVEAEMANIVVAGNGLLGAA